MHIGGACSKPVVRSAEPSAGGHGVSPVMLAPSPGSTTVSDAGAVVSVVSLVSVVLASSASSALKMAMPPATTHDGPDDQAEGAGLALALDLLGRRSLLFEAHQPALVLALSLLARHGGEQ